MSEAGISLNKLKESASSTHPAAQHDFWLSSGHMLLDQSPDGQLLVTDSFLKAYLARPEIMPPEDACDGERSLHAKLMENPREPVAAREISAIADPDARANWQVMLAFRDLLLKSPSLQAAYTTLVRKGVGRTPPLFLNQLVHVIARQAFSECADPFVLRAGELLFRPQRLTVHNNNIMLADEEVIAVRQRRVEATPLLAMFAGETAHMDVLTAENADGYWERSDQFDFILEFGTLTGGRAAFATALKLWINHLLGLDLTIEPIARIDDLDVRWLLGLDVEATQLGNAIWNGEDLPQGAAERLLAFFRIEPEAHLPFIDRVHMRPLYLLLGMNDERIIRVKPQNLITGLPLIEPAHSQ